MKRFIFLVLACSVIRTPLLYAEKPFIYILASGIAIANGVYLSDKKEELHQKGNTYHHLGVDSQLNSEEAARLYGECEAFIDIAIYFNDLQLLYEATELALKYQQLAEEFRLEAEHHFNQSKSKEKDATRYEWYAGASYAAGGILLIKGIYELIVQENLRYGSRRKNPSSWTIEASILPGNSRILLAKKF